MIKYLGSKRTLVPTIVTLLSQLEAVRSVVDLFSGTSRVGHALKAAGYRVLANDHNAYASTLARCYVQADAEEWGKDAERLVLELNALPGSPGYFTESFCLRSRFLHPSNGERVDAIRDAIARKGLAPELEAVLLTSLMEAADRVDSTTGVQMAYLKQWAPRALQPLQLRVPALLKRAAQGKGMAYELDALEAAQQLEADLYYLDPPYNQHKYLGNYHVWETLIRWDFPDLYGVACKRVDCRDRSSPFNSKPQCRPALEAILRGTRARYLLVSFSDEGYIDRITMEALLRTYGNVTVFEQPYKRYVGAQIGIHNPQGQKVGKVSHLQNTEFLYLVTPEPLAKMNHLVSPPSVNRSLADAAPRLGKSAT